MHPGIRDLRRVISGFWLMAVVAVLALVGVSHLAPALGHELVIVRGPSMSPTIPLGALVFETPASAGRVVPGAVVTMTLANGAVVTHRVVALTESNGQVAIEMKGDANASADPNLVPLGSITGIVEAHLPVLGFVLAWLSAPSGMLSVITMLAALYTGLLLIEDIEDIEPAGRGVASSRGQG